jgi:spermidine/putrescine transport system ATP-binding protein
MTTQGRSGDGVAIRLEALERRFGDFVAVKSIDLEIKDGEFFSLIGPSGCGKTTTLRMIAGLEVPSAGKVLVHGRDMTWVPAHRRPVNTVFQQFALFPHLDVFDNVAFGLRERRVPKNELRRRVTSILEQVELSGREKARPRELSGGQQQRVALARSLVLEPEVLLLDEPLGALDLKLRRQMQAVLRRLQREIGITFVYVTHDQEEAFSMSDRVGIMKAGALEQLGGPREVYHRPRTLFVADFVGASNRFPAAVLERLPDGRLRADMGQFGVVEAGGSAQLEAGSAAVAIIRPESMSPNGTDGLGLSGRVTDIAYLGPQVQYTLDAGELGQVIALVASQDDAGDHATDREHRFTWPAERIWLVPA